MDVIRYMCTCAKCGHRLYSCDKITNCVDCGGKVVVELITKEQFKYLDQEEIVDNYVEN